MPNFASLTVLLTRVLVGIYMASAGWGKIRGGVGKFVRENYANRQPDWLPDFIATPYGYAIPYLELVLGLLLIAGLFTRATCFVLAFVLLSIAIAVGPFEGGRPHHSTLLLSVSLLIAAIGPGKLSVDALLLRKKGPTSRP